MIHVYAFAATPIAPLEVTGLRGAKLECRSASGVSALLSRHERAVEPSQDAVCRHAEVVEAAMGRVAAVLPARFGQVFADDAALDRALAGRAGELRDRLERVLGCIELGVRAVRSAPVEETPSATSGTDYLRARLRDANERERVAAHVHASLRSAARDATHRVPPSGNVLLNGAYLVAADGRAGFEEQVRELEREHQDLALVCTGPWPPYSFAEAG